ncbi:GNAT family N-acetyltransferase [Mesorhizobium sp. LHD-90]|uniref:GNAT family N-acetyltransferase n=1 Tax=Mesorhizobium sp. LHD-90 TaxID=3071414 RepID=UPI0027E01309|nr:GNAT family N-acetyltransferase [Mesorhizobium sp. LHD-90]MDQ6434868.1 GNAT family N-acetyltransferase [Mesorhizobium sp. LHD-90]
MNHPIDISSPLGKLRLRPERERDQKFRFELFCNSRPPEWRMAGFDPSLLRQIMRQQFEAQTVSYRAQFPRARFDIIELDGAPVGRIVVNRPGAVVHIIDQAVVPELRGRGIGTCVMENLMEEAAEGGISVRLKVASDNDPSMRLYLRLGFAVIDRTEMYVEMEWRDKELPAGPD